MFANSKTTKNGFQQSVILMNYLFANRGDEERTSPGWILCFGNPICCKRAYGILNSYTLTGSKL